MAVRYYALLVGALYSVLGLLGVSSKLVETSQDIPSIMTKVGAGTEHGFGYLFGLLPINTFEGSIYLVIGIMGIAAFIGNEVASRLYADFLAVWLGLVAILGCLPVANTLFGLAPVYGNDVWLHLGTAVLGAYFGFAMDKGRKKQDPSGSQPLGAPFKAKGAPPYEA